MSYRTYFMWSLTLPIIVGLLGLILPKMDGITFLMAFAAIPYVMCAILLVVLVRRSHTFKQLIWISVAAPLLMGICMYVFFVAIDPPELRGISRSVQLTSIIPLSTIVGFCYVAIVWVGFAFGMKFGFISSAMPPNKSLQPTPKSGAAEL